MRDDLHILGVLLVGLAMAGGAAFVSLPQDRSIVWHHQTRLILVESCLVMPDYASVLWKRKRMRMMRTGVGIREGERR